jgi:hypothetical protein
MMAATNSSAWPLNSRHASGHRFAPLWAMCGRLGLARRIFTSQAWSVRPCVRPVKERQHITALQLTAEDHIPSCIDTVNLKDRLCDIQTIVVIAGIALLLRIVGASTAPTSMALMRRRRSRPQHHEWSWEVKGAAARMLRSARPSCDHRLRTGRGPRPVVS